MGKIMNKSFQLNENGFITNWLVMGPKIEPFTVKNSIDDQLMFEKYMRECVADKSISSPMHLEAEMNEKPRYLQSRKNWFVDFSEFYHLTKKIQLNTKTILSVKEDIETEAILWTYAAVQVYLEDKCVCVNEIPVYKPMKMVKFKLSLNKGDNNIFVRMQNLGVRDTRNIFGIQIVDNKEKIAVKLPEIENLEKAAQADIYLDTIKYKNKSLYLEEPAPTALYIKENGKVIEKGFKGAVDVSDLRNISICIKAGEQELIKRIECNENVKPKTLDFISDMEAAHKRLFENIANIDYESNHEASKFYIYPILAKYAVGTVNEKDREDLFKQLEQLNLRIDCADFIANGFLRLMLTYEIDEELKQRAKEVLLNFRYWMDEEGEDGMCFWSENHSLLFYETLLLASRLYPDEVFIRSRKTGREQYEIALKKVYEWLDDVERKGCEEFLSGGYTVVTVAALLNLVDFAPEDISKRAAKVIDTILINLAKHTFKGTMIGPEGRIYRDVIYPFEQGTQALVHYINPAYPSGDNVWLAAFASTKYKMPEGLIGLMESSYSETHDTGNARIVLNKQKDYILTSVQSPREDVFEQWYNNSFDEAADRSTFQYTKSINERFHGTTKFEPGVYGYQQHLWYAALDSECIVFTNHPGETTDRSSMRPAYWYGNGIFPAVKQKGNCIGVVYQIPKDYPIHFTHLYMPVNKFDEVITEQNWIFARKDSGYIGIWADKLMQPYDDILYNCEYRVYGSKSAYVCICGSTEQYKDFERFISGCLDKKIEFNESLSELKADNEINIKFEVHYNKTQYV